MRGKNSMPVKKSYHIPFNSIYLSNTNANTYAISDYNNSPNFDDYHRDQLNVVRQSNYSAVTTTPNEFEHYSQVMNENEDNLSNFYESDRRDVNLSRFSNVHEIAYPYTIKTNTQYGSIITNNDNTIRIQNTNNDSFLNAYRAVEYSKSPDGGERVRVTNSEDFLSDKNSIKQKKYFESLDTSNLTEEIQTRNITLDEEHEKTFVVKLFPMDDEKEIQEMSLHCD
jgi:hypothetical protein